ncbi:MAG: asparaginase [Deferribacterota bacterium]|nr:asparaginase [Deferribacterota bacterium]
MKNIAIIGLGGTIAMMKDDTGLARPALDSEKILENSGILINQRDVTFHPINLANVPGVDISFNLLLELANKIKELEKHNIDGVVITQGTDTLEETVYFMDLILDNQIPVVFTGAQRNPSLPSSDSAINLLDSIRVVLDEKAVEYGTLLVFNSEIHLAKEVIKTHTSRFDTFKSLEFGPVGAVVENIVYWQRKRLDKKIIYNIKKPKIGVEIISCGISMKSYLIDLLTEKGVDGIILETMGAGHVPSNIIDSLKKAINNNILVVATSRCFTGRLFRNTYNFNGSEKTLRDIGVIFSNWLYTTKARIKLIVLLSSELNHSEIKENFENNFYN